MWNSWAQTNLKWAFNTAWQSHDTVPVHSFSHLERPANCSHTQSLSVAAFTLQWESWEAATETQWPAKTKILGPLQEKFAEPSHRQSISYLLSPSLPSLSSFLPYWEIWSNQKMTSISSHCHSPTSIFIPINPHFPPVITSSCSYEQSCCLYIRSVSSVLVKDRAPAFHPFVCIIFLLFTGSFSFSYILCFFHLKEKKKKSLGPSFLLSVTAPFFCSFAANFSKQLPYSLMPVFPFLWNPFQSGFCSHYSTKICFVKITSASSVLNPIVGLQSLSYVTCVQHVTQWIAPSLVETLSALGPDDSIVLWFSCCLNWPFLISLLCWLLVIFPISKHWGHQGSDLF